jgi:hypothetical protein
MSTQDMDPAELQTLLWARAALSAKTPHRSAAWLRSRVLAPVAILSALMLLAVAAVLAAHDAGLVEMDGNVADDGGAVVGSHDWNTLFDASGTYIGPAGNQSAFISDYYNPSHLNPDFTYHAGSDKDQDNVGTWQCGDVSNPTPKDEILNAYAVLSTGTGGTHVGNTILNFGFERPVNEGTSFMGVWFFQSAVGCNSAPTGDTISFSGTHSDNDILTLINYTNGGASFNIQVFKWVGTGGAYADGTMDLITSSGECGPSEGDDRVCGKTNTASITTNWPPGDGGLDAHQFFEGALDITALLASEGQEVPCFSTFMAETRTSDVFTAQLKDFAGGSLNSCGKILVDKVTDPSGDPTSFEFSADTQANFFLTDTDAPNDSGNLPAGTYAVSEIVPAGWDLTSATCDDGSDPSSIDLAAGETVTCTFNDQADSNIIVQKVTDPDPDLSDTSFAFTTDYGALGFNLKNGESNDSGDIDPGTYAVGETVPAGWDLTSATCDDGSDPSAIDLAAGETVTCTFTNTAEGTVEIVKTVSGGLPNGQTFDFELRTGASLDDVGTTVASTTTDPVTGEADFGGQTFAPGTYQFCEVNMLPGWHSTLSDDPNAFVPNGNDPNADNSVICVEFTLDPGGTATFTIDNSPPPGGDARTIGFWKNWTSCDGTGNQDPVLDDTLASFAGGGILVGDIFVDTCEEAVSILNKSSLDGTKRASDAAYALAAQLLAAELNYQAGAIQCQDATDAIADGQALLDLIDFDATGSYLGPKVKGAKAIQRQEALALAATLDDYNNNLLC